ncbi:MAG: Sensory box histidine kinase [Sphingobacteriales bacterium]|nr:Sensory box histidine kinase [Sphingobacteriales bacterium]
MVIIFSKTDRIMSETESKIKQLSDEVTCLKKEIASQLKTEGLQQNYIESQLQFKTIFQKSSMGNKIINADLRIIKVNRALIKLLGYSKKELIGSRITDLSHPDFVKGWKKLQYQLWTKKKTSFSLDTCILKKDNTFLWCHVTSILFQDHDETLGYTIIEDITERNELERYRKTITDQQLLLQKEITSATIKTQEEERRRIAERLHNSLGQLLYGVKLLLDKSKLKMLDLQHDTYLNIQKANQLLSECIRESRRISHELTPTILQDFGLKDAIEEICQQLSGSVIFQLRYTGAQRLLNKNLEITLYRILQELMLNIVKHAEALQAKVIIEVSEKIIYVNVKDNGKGFEEIDMKSSKGIGLKTIKNSVHLFNGSLKIDSRPGEGSTITINLPTNELEYVPTNLPA